MKGLARYYELNVRCSGTPDPASGYLINIKDIDRAVRAAVLPRIASACMQAPETEPASLLPALLPPLDDLLRASATPGTQIRLGSLRWMLSPYYSLEMSRAELSTVLLRQKFDFAASHRLHVPSLSDEENRTIFGKCNHPGGHGHNYQFEPCIAIPLEDGRPALTLEQIETIAHKTLIEPFDHKHLNLDTHEFNIDKGGVNPTVENIARVFYDLLDAALKRDGTRAELRSMTVWETDRTSATFPAH
jgi:6-pyruvoyltetrahydropterin/6-carboxytetrahydropterin synthase